MKKLAVILNLLVSLLSEASELQLQFKYGLESEHQSVETALINYWQNLEKKYGPVPRSVITLELSRLPRQLEASGIFAITSGQKIEVAGELATHARLQVLRHEIAHVYLSNRCSSSFAKDLIWQEAFATMETETNRTFKKQSGDHNDLIWAIRKRPSQKLRRAFERLLISGLTEKQWSSLEANLTQQIKACGTKSAAWDEAQMLAIIGAREISTLKYPSSFGLYLRPGLYPWEETGAIDKAIPQGSTLKPFMLIPEHLPVDVKSNDKDVWRCPENSVGKRWNWRDALAFSCNGYFLQLPWKDTHNHLRNYFRHYGLVFPTDITQQEIVGIKPRAFISPRSMVKLYDGLSSYSPEVLSALYQTAVNGTLNQANSASWFSQQGIALKSGTVRAPDGSPVLGWIVATHPDFISVITSPDMPPVKLLDQLKKKLVRRLKLFGKVDVQVLGLIASPLKLSCTKGSIHYQSHKGTVHELKLLNSAQLRKNDRIACPSDGLHIRGDNFEKTLYGEMNVTDDVSKNDDSREMRARNGSRYVLTVPMAYYITDVILSEFPNGRTETLKALALAVQANARFGMHLPRPVCDTSHCQVFGRSPHKSHKSWLRIKTIVEEALLESNMLEQRTNRTWWPFSVGGNAPWIERRKLREVRSALGLVTFPEKIKKFDSHIHITTFNDEKKLPCEFVRNQLKLPSCPTEFNLKDGQWEFGGNGVGHGLGIDLKKADIMAAQGKTANEILTFFYPTE
jgi:hypothetical protein